MKITSSEFEACLETLEGPIVVAVSGGADSLALLLLAHEWARQNGERIIAVTVDHGLRADSKNEAQQVQKWAQMRGIEHVILEWTGEKPATRLQETAREARYQLLTRWCKNNQISTILLGHHQQDQEETFWLRLSSGSGLDGLSGMKRRIVRDGITFLRPLLGFSKERLKATLIAENQQWIDDPSNQSSNFFRGRLRTFLEGEGLSPQRLKNTMEKLQVDVDFIHDALQKVIPTIVHVNEGGYLTLKKKTFDDLHPALAKRLLPFLMQWFSGAKYSPRSTQVAAILQKLKTPDAFTAGGIYWAPRQEDILLLREVSAIKEKLPFSQLHQNTLWDNRFWIDHEIKDIVSRETFLAPLGSAPGLKKEINSSIPRRAWPTLPALWVKGKVVSIPHFRYNIENEMDHRKFFYLKPLFHDSLRFTI
ncbi:MAG: tRNA lysidine(34) synthetase TilS [Alphaproteobacteria bacterium 41-28]|nr:MAG: tRNA lysidine(34) synthetase TilS [Alphaproteobacteria bacterium 41-28]